jgi:hypothetical protein
MMNFNIYRLIRLLLPTFLRQPVRLAWLEALLYPFIAKWNEYTAWRGERYYEAHVTAQVISIEAYLNRIFDPIQQQITITDATFDNRAYVALRSEGYDGYYIDGVDGTYIGLDTEQVSDGFIVNVPADLAGAASQISGVVSKVRALGVSYAVVIGG